MKINQTIKWRIFSGCLAIAFQLLLQTATMAQPLGWNYKQGFSVTENSGANVYNYQLRLIIDTQTPIAAGQMNITGDDIRFGKYCSQPTFYDYWIESGMNTANTVVWVKIDTLPASSSLVVNMFYGNSIAAATSSINIFNGPNSATDSVASGSSGGVANSQRGFHFAPNEDILVTSFGKMEPNGSTRYVTLFDYTTQAILDQIQVSGPAAQYSYGSLPSPIWLTSGTQYVLELFQGTGDGYYFGTSTQIGQHLTYYDMRYSNSCTQNTFPTSTLGGYHYGYPDLWYYTKNNVTPAPTYAWQTPTGGLSVDAGNAIAICNGVYITIGNAAVNGNGPYNYLWSPSAGLSSTTVATPLCTPSVTNLYTVSVTDLYGCAAIDTITVTVNQPPVVSFSGLNPTYCINDAASTLLGSPAGGTFSGTGISASTFDPASAGAGTYDIIYVYNDGNGCSFSEKSDTITTIVNSLPAVSLSGLAGLYCQNDPSVTMTGSPAGGTFSGTGVSGNDFDPATAGAGTFDIIYAYTDVNGCSNSDTITTVVNSIPTVSLSGLAGLYCLNDPSVTMTGSPAGGTFSGTGVSGNDFDPASAGPGTFDIIYAYTDVNGCSNSDTVTVVVDPCTGIGNIETLQVNIVPNPNDGHFIITYPSFSKGSRYEIMNTQGKVVFSKTAESATETIDAGNLSAGLYIFKVIRENKSYTFKLAITR